MEVIETVSKGLRRELKVVVEAKELNKRLSARLNELKDQVRLKGFRPGKVPAGHLKKVYGRSIMAEVLEQAVAETSRKAIDERDERPAVQPEISFGDDKDEIEKVIAGDADLAYTMSFEILPQIKITDLAKIKIEKPVAEVTEADIDLGIQRLVQDSLTYEAKDGAAAERDRVTIDFVGKVDGKEFEGGSAEDSHVVIGAGQFIPGFEEGLKGAKAGEKRDVKVTFPKDYLVKELAGKKAVFDVAVKEVGRPVTPDIDDEFAGKLGFESVEKLREGVKQKLEQEFRTASRTRVKRQLLDALDKKHKFDLPGVLVDGEFETIWQQVTSEMERAGRTFKDEDTTEKKARETYRKIAERRVRLGLVLSEIGEKNKIKVSDDEVNLAMMQRIRQFPGQEKEVYEYYQKNPSAMAELRAPIYEEKVVDHILGLASVKDKKVTKDELFAADEDDEAA